MFNEFGFDGNLGFGDGNLGTSEPINWNSIINQAFAVGSHAISAFSGQNSGTQVGYSPSTGVFAIQSNALVPVNTPAVDPYAGWTREQITADMKRKGLLEDAGSGIVAFIEKYPIPIAGGVLALFLLMKEPPKRR